MTTETIPEALEWAASTFGGAEAVVDGETRWTFQELLDEATRIARCLIGSGIERGDKVALWAPNSARWIATSFGVYLAGAVLVPINTRFKGMEAAHVLRRSRARLLLARAPTCSAPTSSDCSRTSASSPSSKRWWCWRAPLGLTASPGTASSPAPKVQTVGRCRGWGHTTWPTSSSPRAPRVHPRGRCWPTGQACAPTRPGAMRWALQQGDRYLCVYPFFHTAGLKSAVLACVLQGATVLPHAVFDPAVVMQRVSEEQITVLPGPPTVFQSMLEHPDRARLRPVDAPPLGHGRSNGPGGGRAAHARRLEDRARSSPGTD